MNLSFKMLLACETAFVFFGTFQNRFQVGFPDVRVNLSNAGFVQVLPLQM
jgi:hypothetical protein